MGVNLIGMPPPSSGAAGVFQILEFLGGYDLPLAAFAGTSESAPGTTSLGAHRTVEAFKHAFAMRMNLGDPDYWPNVTAVLEDMLSPTFNSQLRAATRDDSTLPVEAYGARWSQLDDSGTTALDSDESETGNAEPTVANEGGAMKLPAYRGGPSADKGEGIIPRL